MVRNAIICLQMILLCAATGSSQSSTLSRAERTNLLQQMLRDGEINKDCLKREKTGQEIVSISPLDLNRDGKSELSLYGSNFCTGCGGKRCKSWIYRRTSKGYNLIFGPNYDADDWRIGKTRTNGFFDLLVTNVYPTEVHTVTYKFNGRRYRKANESIRRR